MALPKNQKMLQEWQNRFPLENYFGFDINPYTSFVQYDSEATILEEGESKEVLYILLEGRVKIYVSHANGKVTLVNFAEGPCFLGEMELLGTRKRCNGVAAITSCACYAVRYSQCKEMLLNDVTFLRALCRFLGERSVANTNRYSHNQSGKLEHRLAAFILLTAYKGVYRERHTEAAAFLGVTYRHFLYVLAKFVKAGYLEKCPEGYRIMDIKELERLKAEGE